MRAPPPARKLSLASTAGGHKPVRLRAPPPQASQGTKLSIDDVAFGVLTSGRFLETRLRSQKNTWLRQARVAPNL
eukprot:5966069-Prymnesium_polylepis.1